LRAGREVSASIEDSTAGFAAADDEDASGLTTSTEAIGVDN
jgi:hypothetical protein